MHLALAIVTYTGQAGPAPAQLVRSLELAAAEVEAEVSVWVVDNGGPTSWETSLSLQHLPTAGNVGFARGTNRLLEAAFAAGADHAVCLNPDAVLHRRALAELLALARARPRALLEARQFPEEHPKPYDPRTRATPWASAACLWIPRAVHAELGGFDEDFFLYCEDVDLSWRARLAGVEVLHCAEALVGHRVLARAPSPHHQRHTLLGARVLGRKWGQEDFVRWAEDALQSQGLLGDGGLPPLPPARQSQAEARRVCDFRHRLSFARVRW